MEFIYQEIEEAIRDPINPLKVGQALLKMFDAIQSLHEITKYVHKDIKPDNFRIQEGQVKLIDFGLVSKYLDEEGNHIPWTGIGFTGTPNTGSINGLSGQNHSRRDDLESLGYCFMYTINKYAVPWN